MRIILGPGYLLHFPLVRKVTLITVAHADLIETVASLITRYQPRVDRRVLVRNLLVQF